MIVQDTQHVVDRWLTSLGFRFNPFLQWESSSDPYLNEYLVGHEFFFAVAWNETPALIFAPTGGGKTAMRIYITRSCWVGLGGAHPFPIPYIPTLREELDRPPSPQEHLHGLARAGAAALLIGLAFRPELFLSLDTADQHAVVALLDNALPGPLARYTAILREEATPLAILPLLDHGYRLPTPPDRKILISLCDMIDQAGSARSGIRPPADEQFKHLVTLLLGPLGFQSILLLLDGADAIPDTIDHPNAMVDWLAWPLAQAATWAKQRIYLKSFLPTEVSAILSERLPIASQFRQAHLKWTPPLLADVIRRRVYASTGGRKGSFDAISSPALRDVETLLAQAALPLPREVLVLVSRMLEHAALRASAGSTQLEQDDLDAAINWYQAVRLAANRLSA